MLHEHNFDGIHSNVYMRYKRDLLVDLCVC
jgi:hypothetical protein